MLFNLQTSTRKINKHFLSKINCNKAYIYCIEFELMSIHKRRLSVPGGVLARFQSSKSHAMPACPVGPADRTGAVENSLEPCRKSKSTISGRTQDGNFLYEI
jgi:hypothetical protein